MTTESKLLNTLTLFAEQKDNPRKATLIIKPGGWGGLLSKYMSDLYAQLYGDGKLTLNADGCVLLNAIFKRAKYYVCDHKTQITVVLYAAIINNEIIVTDFKVGIDIKCELVLTHQGSLFWNMGSHHQLPNFLSALKAS